MNRVAVLVLVAVLVDWASSVPAHRRKRDVNYLRITEPAPGLSPAEVAEVLARSPDIRYSDRVMHLTALKNSRFRACFIVDLHPDFFLFEPEMARITISMEPEVVNNPPAYYLLLQRAGSLLTPMCLHMDIYWLNTYPEPTTGPAKGTQLPENQNPPTPPPLFQNHGTPSPVNHRPPTPPTLHPKPQTPPPVNQNPQTPPPVRHNPPTPPPVEVYRQKESSMGMKIPPPVGVYREQLANQNARQEERPVMTPPPLELWKRQHGQ